MLLWGFALFSQLKLTLAESDGMCYNKMNYAGGGLPSAKNTGRDVTKWHILNIKI